jgi:iron-only hydrogenase group A
MDIRTDTPRVRRARNLNIELIFAEHIEKCPTCIWRYNCQLLELADKYKIEITRFKDRKVKRKIYKFDNAVEIDGTQCIDCRNCIDACSLLQKINYLEIKGKGAEQEIVPTKNKEIECIDCGQCAVHCPVGAAQEQTHWEMVERAITNKNKIVIAQFAPAIRVSLGEEFGLPYGKIVVEQMVAGARQLGFDYVFDVNFGADVTTMVEATELVNRIKEKRPMPMMTSCCPAWVKYVEFYHPELIPNLTTSRSPHIQNGGLVKTYWAEKMGVKPKDIVMISIMPCTAKKFESARPELKINGNYPVDYVLTTREFAFMLKKNSIDLTKIKKSKADSPLGEYSGAAAIYGGSGGVMESAVRTAEFMLGGSKGKLQNNGLDLKEVRGLADVKEAIVNVAGNKLRVVVVNGIGNIESVIKNINNYDYIEVMTCPGGCIGGGGQPIPTTDEIRKKRINALYRLDKSKKIRKAHENKDVQEALNWLKEKGKLEHQVLYTKYKKRK